jgi:plastocyanin
MAAAALLFAVLLPMTSTSAGVTALSVQVGAPLFEVPAADGAPADGMRFYSPPLDVHVGDSVTFAFAGFHTATLLPTNTDADAFVQDEASGIDEPFSFVLANPDDGGTAEQPALKFNPAVIAPTIDGAPVTCGTEADPCSAGAGVVNSGFPSETGFAATIDGAVGDTISVLCLIHVNMRLDINVVEAGTPATTQAEIDTHRDSTVESDATKAGNKNRKLLKGQTGTQLGDGTTMWDAYVGFDGAGFALLAMYPAVLELEKDDTVRWQFDQLRFEDHTATLPIGVAKEVFADTGAPLCDLDGDGSEPRVEPDQPPPVFCSEGEVEFAVPPKMAYERGNGAFNGSDYENSGVVGGNIQAGASPFDVTFTSVSPDKGFKYICLVHGGFQSGRVVVSKQ